MRNMYIACMKKIHIKSKQATIRNVPIQVDEAIKRKATQTGKTINEVFLEALIQGSGERSVKWRDLSFLSGTISKSDADKLEIEISKQKLIDKKVWK